MAVIMQIITKIHLRVLCVSTLSVEKYKLVPKKDQKENN